MVQPKTFALYRRWICLLAAACSLYFVFALVVQSGPLMEIKTNSVATPINLQSLWQNDDSGLDQAFTEEKAEELDTRPGNNRLVTKEPLPLSPAKVRRGADDYRWRSRDLSKRGDKSQHGVLSQHAPALLRKRDYPFRNQYGRVTVDPLITGGKGIEHEQGLEHNGQRPAASGILKQRTAVSVRAAVLDVEDGDELEDDDLVNTLLPYKDDGDEEDDRPTKRVLLEYDLSDGEQSSASRQEKHTQKMKAFRGAHMHQQSSKQSDERDYTIVRFSQDNDHLHTKVPSGSNQRSLPRFAQVGDPNYRSVKKVSQYRNQRLFIHAYHQFRSQPRFSPAPRPPSQRDWPPPINFNNQTIKRPGCFRILLIIIFNGAHYGNIPFLLRFYHHGFKHIVFYGKIKRRFPPIPRLHPNEIVVRRTVDQSGGYYQHWTLAQAISDHPSFDGYLWVGDDVYMNYPELLTTMDPTKFWLNAEKETNGVFKGYRYSYTDPKSWGNWPKAFGIPAVRKTFKEIPPRFTHKMADTFGKANSVMKSYSDIGYIPRAFVKDVYTLFYSLRYAIFEITIPTACFLASSPGDRQFFRKPVYLWYDGKRKEPEKFIDVNTTFLHPIKYSTLRNRKIVSRWLRFMKRKLNFGKSPPKRYRC